MLGSTSKPDKISKGFETLALLQAHITAQGARYDWGAEFVVYNDGANNGTYALTYNLDDTDKNNTANLDLLLIFTSSGATLTEDFTITAGANAFQLDFLDGSLNSASSTKNVSTFSNTITSIAGPGSEITQESDQIYIGFFGGGAQRMYFLGDYSATLTDRSITDWGNIRSTMGGVAIAAGSLVPGAGQTGYVWSYNHANLEMELVAGGGGITNGGAANEIVKSDGTDVVGTGVFSTTDGNLLLGAAAGAGAFRTFTAQGSATNIGLTFTTKGNGDYSFGTNGGIFSFINSATLQGAIVDVGSDPLFRLTGDPATMEATITGIRGDVTTNDAPILNVTGGAAYTTAGNGNGGHLRLAGGTPNGSGEFGGVQIRQTVKTETGVTYSLTADDWGKQINFTSAADIAVTLTDGLPTGFNCSLVKKAAGNIILTDDTGTTLESSGTTIATLYQATTVVHEGSNTWAAYGNLT